MRTRCTCIAIISLICVITFTTVAYANELEQMAGMSRRFIDTYAQEVVSEKDWNEALELFHYPPSYSIEEKELEKTFLTEMLSLFVREFGRVTAYEQTATPWYFYQFQIGTGDLPYWQDKPVYHTQVFHVEFELEGPGYIQFFFSKVDGEIELRAVSFGLPASRARAQQRLMEVSGLVTEIISRLMSK